MGMIKLTKERTSGDLILVKEVLEMIKGKDPFHSEI